MLVKLERGFGGGLFKNKKIKAEFGFSLFLFFVITAPALGETLSNGTEVAGI